MELAARGLSRNPAVTLYQGEGQTGVLSFAVRDRDGEEVAQALADRGVAVRAGLHCAPLAHESAGTVPYGTVRISVSDRNQEEEIRQFLMICKKIF